MGTFPAPFGYRAKLTAVPLLSHRDASCRNQFAFSIHIMIAWIDILPLQATNLCDVHPSQDRDPGHFPFGITHSLKNSYSLLNGQRMVFFAYPGD